MKDKLFPYLTGVLCVGVALLAILMVSTRYHLPKNVAHLSDVSAAFHNSQGKGAVADCQAAITAAVENSGGDRPSFGLPQLVPKGDLTEIYLHIHSSVYNGWAACAMQKSVWQVLANGPSGPPPQKTPTS